MPLWHCNLLLGLLGWPGLIPPGKHPVVCAGREQPLCMALESETCPGVSSGAVKHLCDT